MQSGRSMTSQPLVERSRQVMTFLAAPDQKVALLVIPGWPNAVPALPCSWCSGAPWSPQEPKQSLLMNDEGNTSFLIECWKEKCVCFPCPSCCSSYKIAFGMHEEIAAYLPL